MVYPAFMHGKIKKFLYCLIYPRLFHRYPIFAAAEVVASLVAPMRMFAYALHDDEVVVAMK